MDFKHLFRTWKDVFGNWRYILLALFIAVAFYSLNVLVAGWRSLAGFYSSFGLVEAVSLFFTLFVGFMYTLTTTTFVGLIIISLMLGILFSMLTYKSYFNLSYSDKRTGILGGVGAFLAALVPGCAACGIGFASVLGLSAGALAFLPYEGVELSVLAILILGTAIFKTTKNMYVCMTSPSILSKTPKKEKENKFSVNAQKSLKGGKKK